VGACLWHRFRCGRIYSAPDLTPYQPRRARRWAAAAPEGVMLRLSRAVAREHGVDNLCLADGVALNCLANGKVPRDGAFNNIWVRPAAADTGGRGAALAVCTTFLGARAQAQPQPQPRPDGWGISRTSVCAEGRGKAPQGIWCAVWPPTRMLWRKTATSLAAGEALSSQPKSPPRSCGGWILPMTRPATIDHHSKEAS
jgi:carbamoyltransferase